MYARSMLGIMTAMPEEINVLWPRMSRQTETHRAGRRFVRGNLFGTDCVAVFSRWGKTAAASTATELLIAHGVTRIVFFGIAGSVSTKVRTGDVVVASSLVHHDLDASPFFSHSVIPLLGVSALPVDMAMSRELASAAGAFLAEEAADLWHASTGSDAWHGSPRRATTGLVASGDQVISTADQRANVLKAVPEALAVEMEGAAVAQVCHESGMPFACVRTISDQADHQVTGSVKPFLDGLAGRYTLGILSRWLGSRA